MAQKPDTLILPFAPARHRSEVRQCLVALQEFERRYDPRMPPGEQIADAYIARMLERCKECGGRVLVAEIDGEVAGYATVLPRVTSEEPEDGNLEYGLISDLVVAERFRGLGLGRKLLAAAESFATTNNVKYLRIGVLADNEVAAKLYRTAGFSPFYSELEKKLTRS